MNDSEEYGSKKVRRDPDTGVMLKYWSDVPNPDDISGGYIIEMEMPDRYANEPSGFVTTHGYYYVIKSPEYVSYEQVRYIANLVQEAEDAIFSNDGINPNTGKSYTEYIDLDSYVKKYWIEEISKNHDGAKTSQYFYKPADSQSTKLFAGPVWDYDIAFGISSETTDPEGWFMSEKEFFAELLKHSDFEKRSEEIYIKYFLPAIYSFVNIEAEKISEAIEAAVNMNALRWGFTKKHSVYVERLLTYIDSRNDWIYDELRER